MNEEVAHPRFASVDGTQQLLQAWSQRTRFQEWFEFTFFLRFVPERVLFGIGFEEEIERVDHRDVSRERDFEREAPRLFLEDQACQEIAERILLPVDEMVLRFYAERITRHRCAAVRCRPQPHDLRREGDRTVVVVNSLMIQCYSNAH